jgi:hypothetical protein
MWQLTYMYDLAPRSRPDYFAVGSLFHEGARTFLHPINKQLPLSIRLEKALNSIDTLAKADSVGDSNIIDLSKDMVTAYVAHPKMIRYWQSHSVLSVEQWVETKLFTLPPHPTNDQLGIDVYGVLKADVVVQEMGTERIKVVEHKTTGQYSGNYERSLLEGTQAAQYQSILTAYLQRQIAGVDFHIVHKKKGNECYLLEQLVHTKRIERWLKATKQAAEGMMELVNGREPRYNLSQCNSSWGECKYKTACVEGPENPYIGTIYDKRSDHTPFGDGSVLIERS